MLMGSFLEQYSAFSSNKLAPKLRLLVPGIYYKLFSWLYVEVLMTQV
jgi:hypothetical protein